MTGDSEQPNADVASVESAAEALTAVTSLMEQRRRYEGWIAGLDSRREATPSHVFARVHGDYTARLQVVIQELSAHADGLRSEMEALEGRLHVIEQDQQAAQDERSEGELRAHVGELSPEDWAAMSSRSDDRLAELAMSLADVEQERARTRELLDEAERPALDATRAEGKQELTATPARAEEQASRVSGRVSRPSTVVAADGEASASVVEEASVPSSLSEELPLMELSASVIAAEQQILEIEDRRSGATAAADVAAAEVATAEKSTDAPAGASRFDELAFLSSVVDAPVGEVEQGPSDRPDEKARRNSFAQEQAEDEPIVNLSDKRRTPLDHMKAMPDIEREMDAPFASNVTGNHPIKLTENPAEGAKTLKCGECGAMNYPTEWYCERCGAELASL